MERWQDPGINPRWRALYDAVLGCLEKVGSEYEAGRGDWYVMDEDTDQDMQQIELLNLNLLRPSLVSSLQGLLVGYSDWAITVRVEGIDEAGRPIGMGLFIFSDRIIDDLKRDYLPAEFREMWFD